MTRQAEEWASPGMRDCGGGLDHPGDRSWGGGRRYEGRRLVPWATPVDRNKQILCPCQPLQQAPKGLRGRRSLCVNCIFSSVCISWTLWGASFALSLGHWLRLQRLSGEKVGMSSMTMTGRDSLNRGGELMRDLKKACGSPTPSGCPSPANIRFVVPVSWPMTARTKA